MSRIVVPSKPSWKITLIVDSQNQIQISVEDLQIPPGVAVDLRPLVRPRQMNQIELALLLSNTLTSILANTLNVSKRGTNAPTEKADND